MVQSNQRHHKNKPNLIKYVYYCHHKIGIPLHKITFKCFCCLFSVGRRAQKKKTKVKTNVRKHESKARGREKEKQLAHGIRTPMHNAQWKTLTTEAEK